MRRYEKWVLCLIDIVLIKYWFMFDRNIQDNLGVITSLDLLPPISPSTTTFGVLRGNVTTALHKGTQLPVACDALTWPGWQSWWSHLAYKHWQTACGLQKCWLFERLAPTWRFGSRHEAKPTRDEPVWLDLYKCNSCQSLAAPICKEMLKLVKWSTVKEKKHLSKRHRDMDIYCYNICSSTGSHSTFIVLTSLIRSAAVSTDAQITSQSLGEHVSTEHKYSGQFYNISPTFTNLDFPEIRDFPLPNHLGWGRVRSL